jgi:ribosomal protein S18 acetylase RimI-like enzyme
VHPLDNPIWTSLNTVHARFAQGAGPARRFLPAVSPLAGVTEPAPEAFDALAALAAPGDYVALFLEERVAPGPKWTVARDVGLMQMVHSGSTLPAPSHDLLELGEKDAPEMLALARLTRPGPFDERTRELGTFLGVRVDGKLAAMTGERLKVPGFTEMSAVCVHPDHLGRGYARSLMCAIAAGIRARGETPFLHVLPENARAIGLYESLGFTRRRLFALMGLRREA